MATGQVRFGHETLLAYKVAEDLFALIYDWSEVVPRRDYFLREQLLRAALSVPANIAEGYAEYSPGEKARFYRFSRRSAEECATHVKCIVRVLKIPEERYEHLLKDLKRVLVLVSALIQSVLNRAEQAKRSENDGSGTGNPMSIRRRESKPTAEPTPRAGEPRAPP